MLCSLPEGLKRSRRQRQDLTLHTDGQAKALLSVLLPTLTSQAGIEAALLCVETWGEGTLVEAPLLRLLGPASLTLLSLLGEPPFWWRCMCVRWGTCMGCREEAGKLLQLQLRSFPPIARALGSPLPFEEQVPSYPGPTLVKEATEI